MLCGLHARRVASHMQTSRLNVAMIGHGFIGRVHSNAFHQAAHFFQIPYELNLKVVCGRNRATLEAMASQWNWEEVATDWTQVVTRPDIQVVDIAVPNVLHGPIAIAAGQFGKNIFLEKPLGAFFLEAQTKAAASEQV